jgi:ribosomal protein S18 acetylase RimI-like enzyme
MDDLRISFMEQNDIQKAMRVLSVAMLDNPLHVAVLLGRGEKQRREIERMFSGLLTALPGIVFLAREKQKIVGVMRMKSCRGSNPVEVLKEAPDGTIDTEDIAWRTSVWHAEWNRRDPKEQHWHLGPVGVLPGHQGKGIGSRLMQRFCREVDACSAKAYLETEGAKNQRFYEKFGFRIVRESEIFGVRNLYMIRQGSSE